MTSQLLNVSAQIPNVRFQLAWWPPEQKFDPPDTQNEGSDQASNISELQCDSLDTSQIPQPANMKAHN
jgi:hypothetical protein